MNATDTTAPKPTSAPATRTDDEMRQFASTALEQIGYRTRQWVLRIADVVYGETADGRMIMWFTSRENSTSHRLVKVTIILDHNDTYIVRGGYMNRRTFDWIPVVEFGDVYAEMLSDVAVECAETARTGKALK